MTWLCAHDKCHLFLGSSLPPGALSERLINVVNHIYNLQRLVTKRSPRGTAEGVDFSAW